MKARILFAVALFFLATGVAFAAASINLDQCANGPINAPLPCTGAQWQNGSLNAQNSHYTENDSSPYRAVLSGMTVGDLVTITIQYAFTTSSLHTHDYLTSWDHSVSGDPCSGLPCAGSIPISLTIPIDPVLATCGTGVPQQPGVFSGYGISLTTAVYVGNHQCQGQTIDVTMNVSFIVLSPDAVLAWGGHIAQQNDWGIGKTASSLGGAPYHMRILDWTYKNVGNQDRSMQISPAPTAVRVTFFGGVPGEQRSSALPVVALGLLAGTALTIWAMRR